MPRKRPYAPALLLIAGSLTAIALIALTTRRRVAPRRERRREREQAESSVPTAPDDRGVDRQPEETGVGELVHRRYAIVIPSGTFTPPSLIGQIQRHVHELAPSALADFEKTSGTAASMAVGDEYDVTMLGPWNGRVRVAEVTETSFTLVTLDGHPEAGHITFTVADAPGEPAMLAVTIESWARSRDSTVRAAYNTLAIGRQVQAEVWVTFLQRVATLAGCDTVPEVDITSEALTS